MLKSEGNEKIAFVTITVTMFWVNNLFSYLLVFYVIGTFLSCSFTANSVSYFDSSALSESFVTIKLLNVEHVCKICCSPIFYLCHDIFSKP